MDTAPDIETPLTGGRSTANVVRVGDTVRRPRTDASPFVARLLRHLETRGFTGIPRHLGQDEQGRDTFSFVSGTVTEHWRNYDDAIVAQAGAWLRAFHDATRGSELCGSQAVVCHHDPGPNNAVFQDGSLIAFIDFDMSAPGDPMEDLGYMAWSWCVSSNTGHPAAATQAAQVRILLEAYGLAKNQWAGIVPAMMERHTRNITFWSQRKSRSSNALLATSDVRIDEMMAWSARERAFVEAHKDIFLAALT